MNAFVLEMARHFHGKLLRLHCASQGSHEVSWILYVIFRYHFRICQLTVVVN